jgi:hypothetical protein
VEEQGEQDDGGVDTHRSRGRDVARAAVAEGEDGEWIEEGEGPMEEHIMPLAFMWCSASGTRMTCWCGMGMRPWDIPPGERHVQARAEAVRHPCGSCIDDCYRHR